MHFHIIPGPDYNPGLQPSRQLPGPVSTLLRLYTTGILIPSQRLANCNSETNKNAQCLRLLQLSCLIKAFHNQLILSVELEFVSGGV